MAQYRTQSKIIADILATARDMNTDGRGRGHHHAPEEGERLLQQDDQAHRRTSSARASLEEITLEKNAKYRISDKGMTFLQAYNQFEDFAQSFGLRL